MEAATVSALITGCVGLAGAIIGAVSANVVAWVQHNRQVTKERADAKRKREHDTAKECEELCARIADEMESARHPAHVDRKAENRERDREREQRARDAHTRLGAVALYLPDGMRERVEMLGEIASRADDLAYGAHLGAAFHYDVPYTICWNVRREIRTIVAALLKDETLPEPRQKIREYTAALADLDAEAEEYHAMVEQDDQHEKYRKQAKDEFFKQHPELRPKQTD